MGKSRFDDLNDIGVEALSLLLDTKHLAVMSQVLFMSERANYLRGSVGTEGQGFSGSHWIGRFGLLPLLEQWIDRKYDINQYDYSGRTPLSWAAAYGREAVLKLLLSTGKVDVDTKDEDGRTPLSWAAVNGQEAIVKLLIDTGKVDVDWKDTNCRTPLLWAAENGHLQVVRALFMIGVDAK